MAIRLNDRGELYSDYDCPHCDTSGPHFNYGTNESPSFQCAVCMGPVGDSSPVPSMWKPNFNHYR